MEETERGESGPRGARVSTYPVVRAAARLVGPGRGRTPFPSRPLPGRVLFTLRARWGPSGPGSQALAPGSQSVLTRRPSLTSSGSFPRERWRRMMLSWFCECSSCRAEKAKCLAFLLRRATISSCHHLNCSQQPRDTCPGPFNYLVGFDISFVIKMSGNLPVPEQIGPHWEFSGEWGLHEDR